MTLKELEAERSFLITEADRLRKELDRCIVSLGKAIIERNTAVAERDEARMVARSAYWNVPTLIMHLPTGKYWHQEQYRWLQWEDK
jgi:hypothetical protein